MKTGGCCALRIRLALFWLESLPEEGVVLLLETATCGEACLLKGGDVNLEFGQLTVDDGGFPGIMDLLEVVREARTHCSDVPSSKL